MATFRHGGSFENFAPKNRMRCPCLKGTERCAPPIADVTLTSPNAITAPVRRLHTEYRILYTIVAQRRENRRHPKTRARFSARSIAIPRARFQAMPKKSAWRPR